MKKENWFTNHILEVQVFITIILLLITFWYAYSTSDMVNIMKNEFSVSYRPYISIDGTKKEIVDNALVLTFSSSNKGKVPARIASFNTEADGFPKAVDDKEMVLHPGETKYKSNLTFKKEGIQNKPFNFQVRIYYYSLGDIEEKNRYCIEYNFFHNPNKEQIDIQEVFSCDQKQTSIF